MDGGANGGTLRYLGCQMTIDTEARWVERSVQGDLHAFARLVKKPVAVLRDADRRLPRHVLTATAVRHVLSALEHGTASPDLVQRWASFMRRGYIAGARAGPIRPLQIEYEPAAESAIGEILARLDEIGDAIDGDVSTSEVEAMLAALAAV